MSLAPDIASSMRRTDASRATASGMNEFGKRTVSRSGRIGNSLGTASGRSVVTSRSSRSSLIEHREARGYHKKKAQPPEHWELGRRASGRSRTASVGHVVEERRRATLLRGRPLTTLGCLARFLAVLAANRKGQRTQASLGDFVTALEAVAVGPLFKTTQSCVNLVERFRLHLDEREFDVLLDVHFRALALVQYIALLIALRSGVANLLVNRVQQLPTAILEHLPQLVIAACLCRHLLFRRRSHDPLLPSRASHLRLPSL